MTCDCNHEIRDAYNERRRYLQRLEGLALAVQSSRANFSPGDGWTDNDDRVAFQIEQIHDAMAEAAAAVTRADMAHKAAMERARAAADALENRIDTEAGQ